MKRKERFPKNYHGAWYEGELVSLFGGYGACLSVIDDFVYAVAIREDFGFNQISILIPVGGVEPVNEASRQLLEALS